MRCDIYFALQEMHKFTRLYNICFLQSIVPNISSCVECFDATGKEVCLFISIFVSTLCRIIKPEWFKSRKNTLCALPDQCAMEIMHSIALPKYNIHIYLCLTYKLVFDCWQIIARVMGQWKFACRTFVMFGCYMLRSKTDR